MATRKKKAVEPKTFYAVVDAPRVTNACEDVLILDRNPLEDPKLKDHVQRYFESNVSYDEGRFLVVQFIGEIPRYDAAQEADNLGEQSADLKEALKYKKL